MADIEKMFHQIFVSPNDTDTLRFLWRKSPDEVVSDYKTLVHIIGKVDSPCCANWPLRKVPEIVDKSLKRVVANNFYMDDFLSSLSDEKSLIRLSLSLISCLKARGFRLTKWVSNSKVILENIPSSELSPKFINLDINPQPMERVLGMIWNVSEDFFVLKDILGIIASIFNPLGILTPSILEEKLIIRLLWAEKVGWDDQIPDCLEKKCSNCYQKLNEITNVALPCWIGYGDKNKYYIELLIFCDGSSVAYGVATYIKLTNLENKEIKCSFTLAILRLSPLKEKSLSIPRFTSRSFRCKN